MKTRRDKYMKTDFVLVLDKKEAEQMREIVDSAIKNLYLGLNNTKLVSDFYTELNIYLKEESNETSDDE